MTSIATDIDPDLCDCYPGGFTPDTFEGPQPNCPVHGYLVKVWEGDYA